MALKKAPAGKKGKGMRSLPKAVRNKIGFKKKGGVATKMKSGGVAKKKMIKKNVIGSNDKELVAIAQPITGGNAPAAPPITMFCGVFLFNQTV